MIKVAINGFGRIGRLAFRELVKLSDYEIVAINDLSSSEDLAYLLKYDTNHRNFEIDKISFTDKEIIYNDKHINIYSEMDPLNLPWKELNVDIVLECTGKFTKKEEAMKHILAGAKKVLISAPGKGDIKTVVYNVNNEILDGSEQIISAASCTTNCLAPLLKIIDDNFEITKGFISTIHAYTNDQATLDIAHKKGIIERRGRACAMNIVPTTTGAASAIGEVLPNLKGKLDGNAFRVPVSDGSLIDCVLELKNNVSIDQLNEIIKKNENETITLTMDPIVSSDIIGNKHGCIVDGNLTNIVQDKEKQLVKLVAWYDNEMGYTAQMIRTFKELMK